MVREGFVECPLCKSQLCYTQNVDGQESWLCLHCGMTSTTLMKKGSESEKQVSERQPDLYKKHCRVDTDGYVWYPAVGSVPEKGMVFLNQDGVEQEEWVSIPVRELTKKERRMTEYKGKSYVLCPQKKRGFGRDGFVDALNSLDILSE